MAEQDADFKRALQSSDILLPDGEGIVLMAKKINGEKIKKIAGADLHKKLLQVANDEKLKCFYLGSGPTTLKLIEKKLTDVYENIKFGFYSPPFKKSFSSEDNEIMIETVNSFAPDILFVGMTAPKQEKWVYENQHKLKVSTICSIGAVFDFIAETKKRAPQWIINLKMEWFYRSLTSWRLTKRYIYSTPLFLFEIYRIKYYKNKR
ncbi:WecB/TagA/CpsF family glycosyltransferase [Subsaxibacter sp. CAU 1640]|uniref:WecB/TagA/CpsF family glycosyltransferase n=1 Tax=Subsaxibacter sp. CAU 1640 TaxID=2933271 RepID=UPI002006A3AC|nr:WecB/TagA/CpsF family glycosyltransferase [Subsaxibacter sp. CAU 1640]MCK7589532.1 WecB/TagA/CpsF family glycosyltransferase [Subsaxibacter sp. CAU 1640]